MPKKISFVFFNIILLVHSVSYAQDSTNTSIGIAQKDSIREYNLTTAKGLHHRSNLSKQIILPSLLIGYGVVSLELGGLKSVNNHVKNEIYMEHRPSPTNVDDYLRYAPTAAVYALNLAGIKGKNNFKDRTIILAMSNIIMGGAVMGTKKWAKEMRPDQSDMLSFPSGHTAQAFAGAEFMRLEYKDVSPWYGVAGYAMAAATGYLRMYNNRHWLSDVVAGAGVGILSTDIAYALYPSIKKIFSNKKSTSSTMILPTYQQGAPGISLVHRFN